MKYRDNKIGLPTLLGMICILLSQSCISQTTKINKEELEFSNQKDFFFFNNIDSCVTCIECIKISNILEPDSFYNMELRKFIYSSMIGGYDCGRISDSLYLRKSFYTSVITLYQDSFFNNSQLEHSSILEEAKQELLFRCNNVEILHTIADTLLGLNIIDGLSVLWEKTDVSKLDNISDFCEKQTNWFVLAELAVIYHNLNKVELRDIIVKKLSTDESFKQEFFTLKALLSEDVFVERDSFYESIYGGM